MGTVLCEGGTCMLRHDQQWSFVVTAHSLNLQIQQPFLEVSICVIRLMSSAALNFMYRSYWNNLKGFFSNLNVISWATRAFFVCLPGTS